MHAYEIADDAMAEIWDATPLHERTEETAPYGELAPERTGKHPNLGGIRLIERDGFGTSTYILISEWPLCALDACDEDGNPIAGHFSSNPELVTARAA